MFENRPPSEPRPPADPGEAPKPLRTVDDQALTVRRVGVAVVVLAVGWWLALGQDDDGDSSSADSAGVAALREVTYDVTGTANSVDITMETPSGTSQQAGLDVPLTTRSGERGLTGTFAPGAFVYISAQNTGSSGAVTCWIKVNGETIATVTSRGAYAIATCDGNA